MYDFLPKIENVAGKVKKPFTVHFLKTQNPHFQAVHDRLKTFELRVQDRDYNLGDILVLYEWDFVGDSIKRHNTGRAIITNPITYILSNCYGLDEIDCCVMSISISFTIDNFELEYDQHGVPITTMVMSPF
jgi:Domain of unknown function (DUF3850)